MKVNIEIDDNSGFCFGVVFAISMAEDILEDEGKLYCLGDIVHNDEEVSRLKAKGLQIIDHEQLKNIKNEKVLIRAHGEPPETYKLALEKPGVEPVLVGTLEINQRGEPVFKQI